MRKRKTGSVLTYIFLVLFTVVQIYPLFWMFCFSLKNNNEIVGENVAGLPQHWLWSNYAEAWTNGNVGRYFFNPVVVTFATVVFTVVFSAMAA